jgi:uncharacterized phage protein gp47/JayE
MASFIVPTLTQIRARVRAEVESRLELGPLLDSSVLAIFSDVVAAQAHLLHGHLEHLSRQIIPDTAESDFLVRWAALFGVSRVSATPASGPVVFTGTTGVEVPIGTKVRRADAADFATTVAGTLAGGTITIDVSAVLSGSLGNTAATTALNLKNPIAGVTSATTVDAGGLVGGIETETDAALLKRLVDVLQLPPMGGSVADFVAWTKEIAGVTRAFVTAGQFGLNHVGVSFMTDNETDPIPVAGKVLEVQTYLDLQKPVGALVTAFAPAALALDPTIELVGPDTTAIRSSVLASLDDLVRTSGGPSRTIALSKISEAISNASGEDDHVLTVPAADVATTASQVHTVGTITFV